MRILVLANDSGWAELTNNNTAVEWIRATNFDSLLNTENADVFFNLLEDASEKDYSPVKNPVFINSVSNTLTKSGMPENVLRINGWSGFIKRNSWEIAGKIDNHVLALSKELNKKIIAVPDEPGFISARIIAMIINEAYFAKADDVSSEKEIDIAMKLGTNYPYGPFEWADIIGIKNIYSLLQILAATDNRYKPCRLLKDEALKNG